MPLQIIRTDITKWKCDAIVNAANNSLLGGGGVDGAIHRAAGPQLLEECRGLGGCATGRAKITGGYNLPCKYVIHTVGPIWRDGLQGEKCLLQSCYRESLLLAKEHGCDSIAFPLISAGAYGYPKSEAFRVAVDEITEFLAENDMMVYLVIFDKAAFQISNKLFADIQSYIDDRYVEAHTDLREENRRYRAEREVWECKSSLPEEELALGETPSSHISPKDGRDMCKAPSPVMPQRTERLIVNARKNAVKLGGTFQSHPNLSADASLDELLNQVDESFSQMLLRKIDERGMKDAECYRKANVDRKLFSKIRKDIHYKPSKPTAIAFAIALELSLEETRDMLMKAGFALSHSNKFDIIIEYFINKGNYNVMEINEALFAFDQPLLGA